MYSGSTRIGVNRYHVADRWLSKTIKKGCVEFILFYIMILFIIFILSQK